MDNLVWFVVFAFATFRCSVMVAQEEGPFRAFELFRNLFTDPNWIGRGVRCPLCLSFWFGLIFGAVFIRVLNLDILLYLPVSMGLAGVTIWLYGRH